MPLPGRRWGEDKVIMGIAGASGIRGFPRRLRCQDRHARLALLDGAGSWRAGHATLAGKEIAGRRRRIHWVTGAYDPALNLIYWGTGNPGPDYNGDVRKGDNLYSSSLLALDADTGTLRWHFQFTPHDLHDWDANQVPMLIDAERRPPRD